MAQTRTTPQPTRLTTDGHVPRSTRVGAGLGIAGVVLLLAGFALMAPGDAVHTNTTAKIVGYYSDPHQTMTFTGGLLSCAGLLALLPFMATMTSRLGGSGTPGEVFGATARMSGAGYVMLCLAPSQAAGAAALWLGSHGGDASTIVALNTLRAFTYYVALLALAGFLAALGIGGLTTGRLARWMSWSAVAVGTILAAGVAVAQTGLADIASIVALAWIVAASVGMLRRPETVPVSDRG
ncbi:hypothetical protein E4P40_20675 [Blastococcus sp. CT_GayMR20]|uniref:hypothetical protein n=1 Tax=Blastococcus sp. CT_GayMR20 TaxID=2559609 RepID=UPI0010743184|nr:hypothetical protein [Blastococcus sp. CT_GayMR20]TFV71972.1 hypothetical protein E4P40_20675 [Blastococcus sp. CT_GayMR20]